MDQNTPNPFCHTELVILKSWDGKVACCLGVKQLCFYFLCVVFVFEGGGGGGENSWCVNLSPSFC